MTPPKRLRMTTTEHCLLIYKIFTSFIIPPSHLKRSILPFVNILELNISFSNTIATVLS